MGQMKSNLHLHCFPDQLSSGTPFSVCYAQFFLPRSPILINKIKVIQPGMVFQGSFSTVGVQEHFCAPSEVEVSLVYVDY